MQRRQPNPRIRTRADLNVRDGEHYDVSRSLGASESFTRSAFLERYSLKFPSRNPASILPSDYCFNQENKGNSQYPRFLLAEGRGRFIFVGLDGNGDAAGATSSVRPASTASGVSKERAPSADELNTDEIERLIRALKADFPSVSPDDYPVWNYPPPVQVIDCVLSLNRQYDAYVVPRIEAFVVRHADIRDCLQLRELIGTFPSADRFLAEELGTDFPDRARVLAQVLDRVIAICERSQGGCEKERLQSWAVQAKPSEFSSFGVKGFGIAGFQYLRMLFGANTVKPDVHITSYVFAAVGRPVKELEAVLLLQEAAATIGLMARHLDPAIWRKVSGSTPRD